MRILFMKGRQHRTHEVLEQVTAHEYPQGAGTASAARAAAQRFALRDELLRTVPETQTLARQHARSSPAALEEIDAELRFQRADDVADRRLRHLQLCRRAAEIAGATDLQKDFNLPKGE